MVPCVVIGDSIAVGVGVFRPECETVAKKGISSLQYVQTMLTQHDAQTVVISLGVNDDSQQNTLANLRTVRAQVHGERVIWLMPGVNPHARRAIRTVAGEYGDSLVEIGRFAGPDHLHPTGPGYLKLAAITRRPVASTQTSAHRNFRAAYGNPLPSVRTSYAISQLLPSQTAAPLQTTSLADSRVP